MTHPFQFDTDNEASLSDLTRQQQAQARAALTYHALIHPGALFEVTICIGEIHQMPVLTDHATRAPLTGTATRTIRVRSTATPSNADAQQPIDSTVRRWIRLGHADATPATTEPPTHFSPQRSVYRFLETRAPVLLDGAREMVWARRGKAIAQPLARYPESDLDASTVAETNKWAPMSPSAPTDAPRAILFGLHWLQTGGAERWAIESIQLAKDAGFLPIVVTDQNSVHPWITRPELDGCVVITMSFAEHLHKFELDLAHALLQNYDVRAIVLHHSQWLYNALPYFKQQRPHLPVVDCLHIVEYLGGGYPGIAVKFDEFIDVHHVISPQLVSWLHEVQGIQKDKIELAPLTTLTAAEEAQFKPRDLDQPFTIAFIGRLSRQKRPDLFMALVHKLRARGLEFHAILQGDGELRDVVDTLIDRYRLRDVIERRFEDVQVADTLAETDLLVITSINEGLTLTTFEALAAGVPVLSTDVGSQDTLITEDLLEPRAARKFLPRATKQIEMLAANETARQLAWETQQARVKEFAQHTPAEQYFERLFTTWQA